MTLFLKSHIYLSHRIFIKSNQPKQTVSRLLTKTYQGDRNSREKYNLGVVYPIFDMFLQNDANKIPVDEECKYEYVIYI